MGAPPIGAIVVVPFPFSDLSQTKKRPAVVLASASRGDFVLCQITSNRYADPLAIEIGPGDVMGGSLQSTSFARPGKLFTAHDSLIAKQVGVLSKPLRERIIKAVAQIILGPTR